MIFELWCNTSDVNDYTLLTPDNPSHAFLTRDAKLITEFYCDTFEQACEKRDEFLK